MGLFRALLILVIGIFYIQITNKFNKNINKVPIIGETLKKNIEKHKDYMIVIALALSQMVL